MLPFGPVGLKLPMYEHVISLLDCKGVANDDTLAESLQNKQPSCPSASLPLLLLILVFLNGHLESTQRCV